MAIVSHSLNFMILLVGALGIGFVASITGIGGGCLMVPFMILALGYDVKTAIAASLATVVVTSCSAASVYFRKRLVNLKIALLLEPMSAIGAILGAHITLTLPTGTVRMLLGIAIMFIGVMVMLRSISKYSPKLVSTEFKVREDEYMWYYDEYLGRKVEYKPTRESLGAILSLAGGLSSGMFGIGGGIIKVPIMNIVMRVPIKVAAATSSFMVGLTAASGSLVYLVNGAIDPLTVLALALGILPGAMLGAKVMSGMKPRTVQLVFALLLLYAGIRIIIGG